MENNEIMNNDEVMETTEEIVNTVSHSGMKTAAMIGAAMIAGALTYKFVVVPAGAKLKNWCKNRKMKVDQELENVSEDEFEEVVEETEDYSE